MPTLILHSIATGTGEDYTSAQAWDDAQDRDLTAVDEIAEGQYQGDNATADTFVSLNGWTTDATRYPMLSTDSANRHVGTWDASKARLDASGGGFFLSAQYARAVGIQARNTAGGASQAAAFFSDNATISASLLRGPRFGVNTSVAGTTAINSHATCVNRNAWINSGTGTMTLLGCGAHGGTSTGTGFSSYAATASGGTLTTYACVEYGHAQAGWYAAAGATVAGDHNASQRGDAPGASSITLSGDPYTNAAGLDFTLDDADLIGAGSDYSGSGLTVDFLGTTRLNPTTIGWEELGTAGGTDNLTADDLTTGAPTLDSPALGQIHGLSADGITVGAPTLDSPALGQVHALSATDLATSAPTLDSPALGQIHDLSADDLTVSAPTLDSPTLGLVFNLTADDLATAAPTLSVAALGQIHALTADALTLPAPVLDSPTLGQVHALLADDLATGAPILSMPSLGAPGTTGTILWTHTAGRVVAWEHADGNLLTATHQPGANITWTWSL